MRKNRINFKKYKIKFKGNIMKKRKGMSLLDAGIVATIICVFLFSAQNIVFNFVISDEQRTSIIKANEKNDAIAKEVKYNLYESRKIVQPKHLPSQNIFE